MFKIFFFKNVKEIQITVLTSAVKKKKENVARSIKLCILFVLPSTDFIGGEIE